MTEGQPMKAAQHATNVAWRIIVDAIVKDGEARGFRKP